MDKQEIFDKVTHHLLTQMVKATNENTCLYRGPGGTKCAVGCLIPDELYVPQLEGNGAYSLCTGQTHGSVGIPDATLAFFRTMEEYADMVGDLQQIHDDHAPARWEDLLRSFANDHELEWHWPQGV